MEAEVDKASLALLERLKKRLDVDRQDAFSQAVREVGLEAAEQMLENLNDTEVSWSGGIFRVNVWTGNLRRHVRVEWPFAGDEYSAFIFNNAEYAEEIEKGISGEAKKEKILYGGKPARENKHGRKYKRIPMRGSGDNDADGELAPFWTIHEDSVIRDQKARPFTEATSEQMRGRAVELLGEALFKNIK